MNVRSFPRRRGNAQLSLLVPLGKEGESQGSGGPEGVTRRVLGSQKDLEGAAGRCVPSGRAHLFVGVGGL